MEQVRVNEIKVFDMQIKKLKSIKMKSISNRKMKKGQLLWTREFQKQTTKTEGGGLGY